MTKKLTNDNNKDVMETLFKQGYVILENLMDEEQLSKITDELDEWFVKTPRCQGEFYGETTTRYGSLLSKAQTSQELVLHPKIISMVDEVLSPNCDCYQLSLSQAVRIHPGAAQQPVHRDELMYPCTKECEYMLNVIWAIDDFTAENGATRVWPAHTDTDEPFIFDMADSIIAEMPKGSALIFLGSTRHCGGPNTFTQDRTAIIFSYALGWLKQNENQFLAYPPEIASKFPEKIQDLIGYKIHKPNLGGYEFNCPSMLLQGGERPDVLPAVDAIPDHLLEVIEDLKKQVA